MGSFEASYKAFNLHILSAELDEVQYIHYLTVVCTYQQDQQRGGGTELNAMWNKSWAGAISCHTNAAALEGGGAQCAVLCCTRNWFSGYQAAKKGIVIYIKIISLN
jgi:hypothetical protein